MIQISPSILAADFAYLGEAVLKAEEARVDMLHIDVMDGHFVPNISFGPSVVRSLRKISDLFFDVHLMISEPERYVEQFAQAGADLITFHYEATDSPAELLRHIRSLGKKAGISIKPNTDVQVLEDILDETDLVLVMTVEPGFGGQALIPSTLDKVEQLRTIIGSRPINLEVDGGITAANVGSAVARGANVIVAGSAIFGAENIPEAVKQFRKNASEKE